LGGPRHEQSLRCGAFGFPSNDFGEQEPDSADGKVIAFYPSDVTPESRELRTAITQALARGMS
jgi:hypothetical protein